MQIDPCKDTWNLNDIITGLLNAIPDSFLITADISISDPQGYGY